MAINDDQLDLPRAQSSASHRARAEEIKRKAIEQHRRIVEAARQSGDEETIDKALKRIVSGSRSKRNKARHRQRGPQ